MLTLTFKFIHGGSLVARDWVSIYNHHCYILVKFLASICNERRFILVFLFDSFCLGFIFGMTMGWY